MDSQEGLSQLSAPEQQSFAQRADRLVDEAATRGERLLAGARLIVGGVLLVRSISIWFLGLGPTDSAAVSLVMLAMVLGFSTWVLVRTRRGPVTARLLYASVALDATVCLGALAGNPLSPGTGYRGVIFMPDVAGLVLVVAASGLRLSVGAAVLGGVLGALSLAILMWLDAPLFATSADALGPAVTIQVGLIGAAAAASIFTAWRTRSLVREGAARIVQAERVSGRTSQLLDEQMDLRTALTTAALDADSLRRDLDGSLREMAVQLESDLAAINDFVAHGPDAALDQAVDLAERVPVICADLERRLAPGRVQVESPPELPRVSLAGGQEALERILLNLIANAFEGDGASAASRVWVRLETRGDQVCIEIVDDGPGFPRRVLEAPAGSRVTTKPQGSGIGTRLVAEAIAASEGRFERDNAAGGGARVRIQFPVQEGRRTDHSVVNDLLASAATSSERVIAIGRVAVGVLVLARSFWIWEQTGQNTISGPLLIAYPATLIGALLSLFVLTRRRDRTLSEGFLVGAALVDTFLCASGLATNVFWPGPAYPGFAFLPDHTLMMLPVLAAGLRLSVRASVTCGFASLALIGTLVALDTVQQGGIGGAAINYLSATSGLLVAIAAIGAINARRTRDIVRQNALRALAADRAEAELALLLRDHHDVRTLLSSATLNADLIHRELRAGRVARRSLRLAERVRGELEHLSEVAVRLRERAYEEVSEARNPGESPQLSPRSRT